MTPFTRHRGVAAPLLKAHIDTDTIIPSREIRHVSKQGLSAGLFAAWRYTDAEKRRPNPRFVLNRKPYAGATILLCGANFGCGSSREHAVWALANFGIRVVVAPSFGAIFQKNCIANGLLPATVPEEGVGALADWVEANPTRNRPTVDLVNSVIDADIGATPFAIAPAYRVRLLEGLDPIDYTLTRRDAIADFERERFRAHPWVRLREPD